MVHQVINFNFAHLYTCTKTIPQPPLQKVLNVASPCTKLYVPISNILDIRTKGGHSFIKQLLLCTLYMSQVNRLHVRSSYI